MKGCEIEGIYRTRPFTNDLDISWNPNITDKCLRYLMDLTSDLNLSCN